MMKKFINILTLTGFLLAVLFLVVCCDDFEPQLDIDKTEISMQAKSDASSFEIISNTDWTISVSEEWLSVSPQEGSNNTSIAVNVTENTDSLSRSATLTIEAEDVESKTVTVIQNGALSVSTYELVLEANENNSASFAIASDTSWAISSSEEWLSVDPASGLKSATVNVTAQPNESIEERSAVLTVAEDGATPQNIEVTQIGAEASLSLSALSFNIESAKNSTGTFEIISNVDWSITFEDDWISLSQTEGSNNATITVTADQNPIGTERSARIVVASDQARQRVVKVFQAGIPCLPEDEIPCDMSVCSIDIPSVNELTSNPFLPDPFTFYDGRQVTNLDEWECRRAEISVLSQEFEFGYKPCTDYEATTGSFNDTTITVTVSDNNKTISFNCAITYPNTGTAPYPAVISLGFSNVNTVLQNMGVAIISFPNDLIGQQSGSGSRGKGLFYEFFCADHSAGALMAWAWGASRLIDALEKTPEANINVERLAVTGCSRNGKGAMVIGAFDERIALTIPFESGSGGSASWRVSDFQKQTDNVQTLSQIVGENCWLRNDFSQFSRSADLLPFDHHMILGLCAPRGLLVVENTWMEWLGNLSAWTTGNATHKIYQALGVPDNMGFSQVGNSGHCFYGFSEIQIEAITKYAQKFLFDDQSVEAHIMYTDGELVFDEEKWINWEVPQLY